MREDALVRLSIRYARKMVGATRAANGQLHTALEPAQQVQRRRAIVQPHTRHARATSGAIRGVNGQPLVEVSVQLLLQLHHLHRQRHQRSACVLLITPSAMKRTAGATSPQPRMSTQRSVVAPVLQAMPKVVLMQCLQLHMEGRGHKLPSSVRARASHNKRHRRCWTCTTRSAVLLVHHLSNGIQLCSVKHNAHKTRLGHSVTLTVIVYRLKLARIWQLEQI